MERPVVRLEQALYGHPDAGTYWEEHCDSHCRSVGFEPIQDWPSCYWHDKLQLLLVIYVDDFKMSGPTDSVDRGWVLLKRGLSIEKPSEICLYLGCKHEVGECKQHGGVQAVLR